MFRSDALLASRGVYPRAPQEIEGQRRANQRGDKPRGSLWRIVTLALALSSTCQIVVAHQISVSTGTVIVGDDLITITLETPAEDLLHHDPSPMARGGRCNAAWLQRTRSDYEPVVLAGLLLRNAEGERLPGRVIASSVKGDIEESFDGDRLRGLRLGYVLEYPAPPSGLERFLTFQRLPGGAGARIESQLALDVRSAGDRTGRTITLTSRGNVETLEFPLAPLAPSTGLAASERFKTVFAIITAEDGGLAIEAHVPLALLETWRPVERLDPDFLDFAEQQRAADLLAELMTANVRVRCGGVETGGRVVERAVLSAPGKALEDHGPRRRVSAWTARAAVKMRFASENPQAVIEVTWGLFNNAILTARATVNVGLRTLDREFTTYRPTLEILAAAP